MKVKRIAFFVVLCFLFINLMGCQALARKFTRKPKKDKAAKEELVLAPEEYKSNMSQEDLYRQYFLFWKSWQDELIVSLVTSGNHKKQVDCVDQAINNLINLRPILNEAGQKRLDIYIDQLYELRDSVASDIYGNSIVVNRQKAERIKRNILRDFSYGKTKSDVASP